MSILSCTESVFKSQITEINRKWQRNMMALQLQSQTLPMVGVRPRVTFLL